MFGRQHGLDDYRFKQGRTYCVYLDETELFQDSATTRQRYDRTPLPR